MGQTAVSRVKHSIAAADSPERALDDIASGKRGAHSAPGPKQTRFKISKGRRDKIAAYAEGRAPHSIRRWPP